MSGAILSLILDFVILLCLGGTIYYAFKLSKALSHFKSHRDELQSLMVDLTQNIDKALQATEILKQTSSESGQELQDIINQAYELKEELIMVNAAGDGLAARLEGLAKRNSQLAQTLDSGSEDGDLENLFAGKQAQSRKSSSQRASLEEDEMGLTGPAFDEEEYEDAFGFDIQDPEFEGDNLVGHDLAGHDELAGSLGQDLAQDDPSNLSFLQGQDSDMPSHLKSEAERDLFKALKRKKAARG